MWPATRATIHLTYRVSEYRFCLPQARSVQSTCRCAVSRAARRVTMASVRFTISSGFGEMPIPESASCAFLDAKLLLVATFLFPNDVAAGHALDFSR